MLSPPNFSHFASAPCLGRALKKGRTRTSLPNLHSQGLRGKEDLSIRCCPEAGIFYDKYTTWRLRFEQKRVQNIHWSCLWVSKHVGCVHSISFAHQMVSKLWILCNAKCVPTCCLPPVEKPDSLFGCTKDLHPSSSSWTRIFQNWHASFFHEAIPKRSLDSQLLYFSGFMLS